MKEIVDFLIEKKLTISTMESCTGGLLASTITNVEGASDVFSFGVVTYSNEYKIKFGVSKEIIDKYSVYSIETSNEMSMAISNYTSSDIGIGITGKLNGIDKNNLYGEDNIVYVSIYLKEKNKYYNKQIEIKEQERLKNKEEVIEEITKLLYNIFVEEK